MYTGLITVQKPAAVEETAADPNDIRYLKAFLETRKWLPMWLAREARDGSLVKRFRASGAAYGETWPPLFKHHDCLNKVEIVIVLEMCRPEEFPMELWDEWPSVES